MESNGAKGKIHVSQATADALTVAGKDSWLTQRPDKIVAKGKGEMTTYFVSIHSNKAMSASSLDPPQDNTVVEDVITEIGGTTETVSGDGELEGVSAAGSDESGAVESDSTVPPRTDPGTAIVWA